MKKLLLLCTLLATGGILFAQQTINDPNAQVREAKNFHAIDVSNAFDVYLTQGTEEGVAVSAAKLTDRDDITVEVKEGTLYISMHKGWKFSSGNRKLKAYVSFKQIDKLHVSGACDVYVSGVLKAPELEIRLSGASDLKGKLEIADLRADLSGASDMVVSGTATKLSVEASGASDFKGFDLATEVCDAHASGASDIKITVSKELSVQASGASDVKYKGDGVIRDIRSSGSSSVSRA